MLRLFAALPVPPDVSGALLKLQKDLPGAHWRPQENFHITLCFFGEISHTAARDLDELLGEIETPAFELALEGAGWFGRREPTAVWARVRESDELRGLASACARAARRLGLTLDRAPYTPHVTLAYCHATPLEDARTWSERHQTFRSAPWLAGAFHLYSSRARASGPSLYVAEADYPLAGFISPEEMY
ncbi:MAG: RNA 2',3'-cyclic phosphodiesterase [Hyphomonas sp.]|uniref:RNA 2',3'-cyclic phosphodiesterase n=1 Tax=Hyphomonas sp. TaxID=87 RepID=UPI00180F759A|nr:RNA 2',3'-cyclic phosphodiesterase [Hyphomonas sp.]MBA3068728.1 RNA 2',3'-cyclic phosphodiesterase [Hyphomonas sp.]MBU3921342.1 RNA 2',3'-cyclic phosphodiesterase [Alphaproteobacteria bacterium]MBU4063608.1 RNA 2',3'-cyclic phosphodiesterase [Alphaproteobacteria bacterium]MBU4165767.1 RNA 2',3'-cyclic phosphodiesterase [Alphaproteobacteria bacterium]